MTADRGTLSSVAASFGARACVAPRAHLKRSYRNTKRALLECTEKNEPIAIAGRQAQQVAFCFRHGTAMSRVQSLSTNGSALPLVNEQLRVSHDVDEQDLFNFESEIRFRIS